ncbi:hypothetical protein [Halomonas aquatica]|uniref:Uncharacterized protein n=1 Tax=Halomonas aquatica TaxID=3151123 RepID=A0ABV1NE53_9GAMM
MSEKLKGLMNYPGITYIQLWRQSDWGVYCRRNEVFTHFLEVDEDTENIFHIEEMTLKVFLIRFVNLLTGKANDNVRQHIFKCLSTKPIKTSGKIFVSAVLSLGSNNVPILRSINTFIIKIQLRFKLRGVGGTKVLIVYPPSLMALAGIQCLKHDLLAFDLIDDVAARCEDDNKKIIIESLYSEILPKADKVITTGASLKRYSRFCPVPVEVVPNGVDLSPYEKAKNEAQNIKQEQVVGYVGSINKTFDPSLVEECLRELPDVKFIFFGFYDSTGEKHLSVFNKYKNFTFNGSLHHSRVPGFLTSCDVLIMPKANDVSTVGGDSMKIYQYLATGNSIVSTGVDPASSFSDVITIAEDPVSFADAVKSALSEASVLKREKRVQYAAQNSWSVKVKNFTVDIKDILRKKGAWK